MYRFFLTSFQTFSEQKRLTLFVSQIQRLIVFKLCFKSVSLRVSAKVRDPVFSGALSCDSLPPQRCDWQIDFSFCLRLHGGVAGRNWKIRNAVFYPDGSQQIRLLRRIWKSTFRTFNKDTAFSASDSLCLFDTV